MGKKSQLFDLVNKLKNIFVYKNKKMLYTDKVQDSVNALLEQIAEINGVFAGEIKNEKNNIKDELTITDSTTGKKIELVDINSIDNRVKNVLKDNNIFSCLKALALSNRCAHSFDGDIDKTRDVFIKYYKMLYRTAIDANDITFMKSINEKFPEIVTNNIYCLDNIDDYHFEKNFNIILGNSQNVDKGVKISILRSLNVSFNIKDNNEIDIRFNEVLNNRNKIINAFLVKKYNEGTRLVELQSKMFSVKDDYISMIGQLLANGVFENIKYELIKTSDGTPGFENMLIIDDRELSYYIEVHMPNFIATSLIDEYNLVFSPQRRTQKLLHASTVYKRNRSEMQKIFKELKKRTIGVGKTRAEIITRGMRDEPPADGVKDLESCVIDTDKTYSFITNMIVAPSSEFAEYLNYKNIYREEAKKNSLIMLNENYPQEVTENIACSNYYNIYKMFSDDQKMEFITYALYKLKNQDLFDKAMFNYIKNHIMNYDVDKFVEMIIYKNKYKRDFMNKNIDKIDEIINDNGKENLLNNHNNKYNNKYYSLINNKIESINLLIDKYIDVNLNNELNKEINNDDSKYKK